MIGREIADPFYSSARFAPWQSARVVVLFPNTFSDDAWLSLPPYNHSVPGGPLLDCDRACVKGHLSTSVNLKHFVACALPREPCYVLRVSRTEADSFSLCRCAWGSKHPQHQQHEYHSTLRIAARQIGRCTRGCSANVVGSERA